VKIIVGLGNPGEKYENTYHNVGFLAVDMLADKLGARWSLKSKLLALVAETNFGGEKVLLVKPQTFMNLSGESVRAVVNFFKVDLKDVLVIYDDLDLPIGTLRYRQSGSSGTHNGMRNILKELGSGDFPRARIGTANDNPNIPTIDYVLSKISTEKRVEIDKALLSVTELAKDFVSGKSAEKIMCDYNGKKS
jgi:PTH1 family peptidyl-tRNA hydrolase